MIPQIKVDGLHKVFNSGEGEVFALRDINIEIFPGEFVCILGPSGCGKSTLLNAIGGFSLPSLGKVFADGKEVSEPGPDRAMVFQEYAIFPWMTVEQNIGFGLEIKGMRKQEITEKVDAYLHKLQLYEFRRRYPKDLSGGMRQRVAIARALALDSPMMLMDEPFGALDALTRRNLQEELLSIWEEFKKTIVFVTHNIEEAVFLADRVVVMTYRPGTIKKVVTIDLPRPRDFCDIRFFEFQKLLSESVMEEQKRFEADQKRAKE